MTTIYRFAILAGVSSDRQAAEGKDSIPNQVEMCRKFIKQTPGGIESAGPFVMDGFSRTGYDSLEIAMRDIPPLKAAIGAAGENKYDILLLDNYDRLGDLGHNLLVRFSKYKKQIHSIRQGGRLFDPATYEPSENEFADIGMAYESMIQKYRLSKIRRGWNVGVPARIKRGLAISGAPLGYSYVGNKEPHRQNDDAQLVVEIKNLFLRGRSLSEIGRYARSKSDVLKFSYRTIGYILKNPFYYGMVVMNMSKLVDGKRKRAPRSEWTAGQGRHKPLWDEDTHRAILAEFDRRAAIQNRSMTKYPLAGLFRCTTCKEKMNRHSKRIRGALRPVIACHAGHAYLLYDDAVQKFVDKFAEKVRATKMEPRDRSAELAALEVEIETARTRRRRVQEGYEASPPLYTAQEAAEKILMIEEQIETLSRQRGNIAALADYHNQMQAQAAQLPLDNLRMWIEEDDPAEVNQILTGLCKTVWVQKDKTMEIELW